MLACQPLAAAGSGAICLCQRDPAPPCVPSLCEDVPAAGTRNVDWEGPGQTLPARRLPLSRSPLLLMQILSTAAPLSPELMALISCSPGQISAAASASTAMLSPFHGKSAIYASSWRFLVLGPPSSVVLQQHCATLLKSHHSRPPRRLFHSDQMASAAARSVLASEAVGRRSRGIASAAARGPRPRAV